MTLHNLHNGYMCLNLGRLCSRSKSNRAGKSRIPGRLFDSTGRTCHRFGTSHSLLGMSADSDQCPGSRLPLPSLIRHPANYNIHGSRDTSYRQDRRGSSRDNRETKATRRQNAVVAISANAGSRSLWAYCPMAAAAGEIDLARSTRNADDSPHR